jgi:hypothetical protein
MQSANETETPLSVGDLRQCLFPSVQRITTLKEATPSLLVGELLSDGIKPNKLNGYSYHLDKIDWAVIGWLTWANDSRAYRTDASEKLREQDFKKLINNVCGFYHLRDRQLLYYHKTEWGVARGHYHFLLGRHGTEKVNPADLAQTMQRFWENGRADVRAFNDDIRLKGLLYQTDYEFDRHGQTRLHPEYFSPALRRELEQRASINAPII